MWATGVVGSVGLPSPESWIEARREVRALGPRIKQALRGDKTKWYETMAARAAKAAKTHDTRALYSLVKTLAGR
eukprot:8357202-Alexandrium_andersonii.AAC.1